MPIATVNSHWLVTPETIEITSEAIEALLVEYSLGENLVGRAFVITSSLLEFFVVILTRVIVDDGAHAASTSW